MKAYNTKTELCKPLCSDEPKVKVKIGDIVITTDYGTIGVVVASQEHVNGNDRVKLCSLVPGDCRGAAPKGEMVWINRNNVMVLPNAAIIKDCTK